MHSFISGLHIVAASSRITLPNRLKFTAQRQAENTANFKGCACSRAIARLVDANPDSARNRDLFVRGTLGDLACHYLVTVISAIKSKS